MTQYRHPFAVEIANAIPDPEKYTEMDLHRDMRAVFYAEGGAGLRVLAAIIMQCGVFEASYVAGDSYATALNEGKREVGIWLMQAVDRPEPGRSVKRLSEVESENST